MSWHLRGTAGQDPGSRAALWVCHSLYASAFGFPNFPPLAIVPGGPRGTCAEPDGRVGVSPSEPLSRSGGSQVHPVWLTSSSAVVPAVPLVFRSLMHFSDVPSLPWRSLMSCLPSHLWLPQFFPLSSGLLFCLLGLPLARTQHGDTGAPPGRPVRSW